MAEPQKTGTEVARPSFYQRMNILTENHPVVAGAAITAAGFGAYKLGEIAVQKVRERLSDKAHEGAKALVAGALKNLIP